MLFWWSQPRLFTDATVGSKQKPEIESVDASANCFSRLNLFIVSPLQVLSGCAIIVRGQPRGGPPPERQINLSNIRAGALARRAAQGQPDTKDVPDEVSSSSSSMVWVCLVKDDCCVALNNKQLVVVGSWRGGGLPCSCCLPLYYTLSTVCLLAL